MQITARGAEFYISFVSFVVYASKYSITLHFTAYCTVHIPCVISCTVASVLLHILHAIDCTLMIRARKNVFFFKLLSGK